MCSIFKKFDQFGANMTPRRIWKILISKNKPIRKFSNEKARIAFLNFRKKIQLEMIFITYTLRYAG